MPVWTVGRTAEVRVMAAWMVGRTADAPRPARGVARTISASWAPQAPLAAKAGSSARPASWYAPTRCAAPDLWAGLCRRERGRRPKDILTLPLRRFATTVRVNG